MWSKKKLKYAKPGRNKTKFGWRFSHCTLLISKKVKEKWYMVLNYEWSDRDADMSSLLIRNSVCTRLDAMKTLKQGLLSKRGNDHRNFLLWNLEWKRQFARPRHKYRIVQVRKLSVTITACINVCILSVCDTRLVETLRQSVLPFTDS
jgi:hypothetical protein